jgi:hypothetical protein
VDVILKSGTYQTPLHTVPVQVLRGTRFVEDARGRISPEAFQPLSLPTAARTRVVEGCASYGRVRRPANAGLMAVMPRALDWTQCRCPNKLENAMRMFPILVVGSLILMAPRTVLAQDVDWPKVDETLGRKAAVSGDVHRYAFRARTSRWFSMGSQSSPPSPSAVGSLLRKAW